MTEFFDTAPAALLQLFWATDPTAQMAILAVLGLATLSLLCVYGPLCLRLLQIARLQRAVAAAFGNDSPRKLQRREIAVAFDRSPLAFQWQEFLRRWRTTCAVDPDATSLKASEVCAPVRLSEVLDEHPALPLGARRSLLPALPSLFLATGLLGTFVGLTLAIPEVAPALDRSSHIASIAQHVGLALRSSLWGLALSIAAGFAARWLEGRFDAESQSLDLWVEGAYGSLTSGELAMRAAHAQSLGFDRLRAELLQVTEDLTESLEAGLGRIEQSSARAASLVSEEQRAELGKVVADVTDTLKQGLEEHLRELQSSLRKAVEHQESVTGGLARSFEQMVENSELHERTSESLVRAADSVKQAAAAIDDTAADFRPLIEELRQTGSALSETASHIQTTQKNAAETAAAVATAVDHSRRALDDQHELLETSLGEIRGALGLLNRGLGENLSRALRGVDNALEQTVGRLRETLLESNETIDRMTGPIHATEAAVLEMRRAMEQVRADFVSLNNWLIQSAKPVRSVLNQLDDKATFLTRALQEFGDRARGVEHDMDELRSELRASGRGRPDAKESQGAAAPGPQAPEEPEERHIEGVPKPGAQGEALDWRPETETEAEASAAGETPEADRAEQELALEHSREGDTEAEAAPGAPDYRMQAPELFAGEAARGRATVGGLAAATPGAGEPEPESGTAEGVSLSGLLSRPPPLAGPAAFPAPPTEKPDRTPAESPAADDRAAHFGDTPPATAEESDPDASDGEEEIPAASRHAFGRLFGGKK